MAGRFPAVDTRAMTTVRDDATNTPIMERYERTGWSRDVELTRPATGERLRLLKSGSETGGRYVEGISAFPRTLAVSPLHEHPYQEERLQVVSGTLYVRVAGRQHLLGPGTSLVIPAGAPHEIANAGAETSEVIWQFVPALRSDAFLHEALEAIGSGRT